VIARPRARRKKWRVDFGAASLLEISLGDALAHLEWFFVGDLQSTQRVVENSSPCAALRES